MRKPCSARTVAGAGELGRDPGGGESGSTAVLLYGCASRGVRKTLDGVIFLTGSPSCLDPAWCPGGGCCSGVVFSRASLGAGCRVSCGATAVAWRAVCGRREVLGNRPAFGIFLTAERLGARGARVLGAQVQGVRERVWCLRRALQGARGGLAGLEDVVERVFGEGSRGGRGRGLLRLRRGGRSGPRRCS